MLGKYNVVIEYLDKKGDVFDSHDLLFTDYEDEATKFAEEVELTEPNTQVAIWEWDDDEDYIVVSWIVKEYER